MELILAKQSVMIKCRLQASIMMGNYEFYYAGGLLCRLSGEKPAEELRPAELAEFLKPVLHTYESKNVQEQYLMKMLREYKASDEYDGQMRELFQMGMADTWMQGK